MYCSVVCYVHSYCVNNLWNSFHLAKLKTLSGLKTNSPFLSPFASGNHPSTFCLYESDYTRHYISMESYSTCPFLSGSFHLEECPQFPSFLMLNKQYIPYSLYTPHWLIPSLVSGHLGCFHVLVMVNNAAVNTNV